MSENIVKDTVLLALKEHSDITKSQLHKRWNEFYPKTPQPHRSYIYQIAKGIDSAEPTDATKETETTAEEKPKTENSDVIVIDTETEPTPEEITKAEELAGITPEKIKDALLTGTINKEHIKAVFKIENLILKQTVGDEYQLDVATINLLGELGEKPVDRIISKYLDKNVDLWIFLGLVAYAHAPLLIKIWKDSEQRRKDKKKEKENEKTQNA